MHGACTLTHLDTPTRTHLRTGVHTPMHSRNPARTGVHTCARETHTPHSPACPATHGWVPSPHPPQPHQLLISSPFLQVFHFQNVTEKESRRA